MEDKPTPSCSSCGPWWRLPLMLALVLAAVLLSRGRLRETVIEPPAEPPAATDRPVTGKTVSLTIDFGDGRPQEYEPIAWRQGMTVYDLTRETPRENRRLDVRGSGASAFLESLDGIANEGPAGRNWAYHVNGKPGDRSFGVYELQPGDQVLWRFSGRD
jgi:hypothetical protein